MKKFNLKRILKNGIFIILIFITASSFGQSVMVSGNVYLAKNSNFNNMQKSDNYVIFTIRKNEINLSVNGNNSKYKIIESNLTDGGKTLKYSVYNEKYGANFFTISQMSKSDVIVFMWDQASNTFGLVKMKLTNDDKRILGLY